MNIAKFTEEALLKITQHQDSSTSSSQVIEENPALSFDNQFVPQIIQISSGSETTEVQGLDAEKIIDVLKWNDTMEPGEEQFGQQIIIDHHQQPINLERVIFLTDSDNQTLLSCENTPTEDAHEEISIKEPQLEHPVYECTQAMLKFSAFEDFKEALHYYESQTITKFILRNQSKDFQSQVCLHEILNNDQITSNLPKIRWEFCAARDFLPIPYMGIPYISVGKQVYQCHQGKDYNTSKKEQYELKREILNQASRYQIKQRQKGVTKKTDCPVLFGVRKLFTFPAYPLHENSKRGRALIADKIRKQLFKIKREPCTCNENKTPADNNSVLATGCLEYFTRFPSNNEHNHSAAKAATTLKLPRRLPLRVQDHNEEGAKAKKSSRSKKTVRCLTTEMSNN